MRIQHDLFEGGLDPNVPHFSFYYIERGGKRRLVGNPNIGMRRVHEVLIKKLEKLRVDLDSAYGGVKGRSHISNAKAHIGNSFFYILDIKNAYGSVPIQRLAKILSGHGMFRRDSEVAIQYLREFCTVPDRYSNTNGGVERGLITGAPSSPHVFNICCATVIDPYIIGLFEQGGMVYTRYFDDLVISSPEPIPARLRKRIRGVVENADFSVNHRKSLFVNTLEGPVPITGLILDCSGGIGPKPAFLDLVDEVLSVPLKQLIREERERALGTIAYLMRFDGMKTTKRAALQIDRAKQYLRKAGREQKKVHTKALPSPLSTTFIDYLRREIPIEDLIGRYVTLRRSGRDFGGLCPFHNEKSPSFTVAPEKHFYHCFGCGAHGDVFDFVGRILEYSFREAVVYLLAQYGDRLDLPED